MCLFDGNTKSIQNQDTAEVENQPSRTHRQQAFRGKY